MLLNASLPRGKKKRTLTGTRDLVQSSLPWWALWAATFHIWGAHLTSSSDTPMRHGRAAGEVWLGQNMMRLKTWQYLRAFRLRTTQFNVTTTPWGASRVLLLQDLIHFLIFRSDKERWRGKENSHARFWQIHHDLAQGAFYCGLFSIFCTCTFYFIVWLAGTGLVS